MRYPTPQLLLVSCAMMSSLFFLSLPLMITSASLCPAFSPCRKPDKSSTSAISASCNRRDFGLCITEAAFLGVITAAQPANAEPKPSASQIEDIQKLQKGLDRLDYFLSHWVEETTVCGKAADSRDNPYIGDGKGCERTPLAVMSYLGFKDMNNPLFNAPKTMRRLENLVPPDRITDYLDAMEKYAEASEDGSSMAFVSSWGEANPGGGKDRVQLFIERAKKNVVDARDSLKVVVELVG